MECGRNGRQYVCLWLYSSRDKSLERGRHVYESLHYYLCNIIKKQTHYRHNNVYFERFSFCFNTTDR